MHLHAYLTNGTKPSQSQGSNTLSGLRIGIFEEHVNDSDDNVKVATKRAMKYYQDLGADIVHITIPHLQEIRIAHGITITTEMYSFMEQHYHSSNFY